MSYRSVKRILGETRLELKCFLLFGTSMLFLIVGSFWWYSRTTDELFFERNRLAGGALVDATTIAIHWRGLESDEDFKHDLPDLLDYLQSRDYSWRTIKPQGDPESEQPPDAFERQLIQEWNRPDLKLDTLSQSKQVYSARFAPDNPNEYQYYQPVYANSTCILCHRVYDPDLIEGDLMAVFQIRIPYEETVNAQNKNRATLLATAFVTVFLSMVSLYFIVRYIIVKPLTHLRDVSNQIARGDINQRAEIHTGDEFEELASSFNRMVRHMVDSQEKLRGLNTDLDNKVDQLAQVNMRLYEMNRLKSDFLATVSHELRTPLNSIIGFSEVLAPIKSLDDKQRKYVENIQQSGRMLLEMINDILDLAKIESGRTKVRPTEFKIDAVVAAQCDMARPLTEKKNIDLVYEIQPDLPELVQDQSKVQQILNNLLSNAIKFTPEGGRITITAERNARSDLHLVVADTGVGIAEDDQRLIFEKFRQGTTVLSGGDAMTREYSGTGLGLSIVKELCRLLGGEISLESELGKGSTFTVRLPWTRSEQPQLDSGLGDELEELTRPRRLDVSPASEAPASKDTVPFADEPHPTPPTADEAEAAVSESPPSTR